MRKFVFFGLKIDLASRLDGSSRFVEVWRFGRNSMLKRSFQDFAGDESQGKPQGGRGVEVKADQVVIGGGSIFT